MDNLVISPTCYPEMTLDESLVNYSQLGFKKFEVFTHWLKSAFDIDQDPQFYLKKGEQHGMHFTSVHLPKIDSTRESLDRAVRAARFAKDIGANIVLYKADSRDTYIDAAKPFLDAIDGLNITPVLQNHAGQPISSLQDYQEVIEGISDPRMKTLLEVGHFNVVGVSWQEGYELLNDSIALVHIKEIKDGKPVPYGQGDTDLPGLFEHMRSVGYQGDYVVELEIRNEHTPQLLREAVDYLQQKCLG